MISLPLLKGELEGVLVMNKFFNKRKYKDARKKLRNNMPTAEIILWNIIRNKQIKNYKFRRQHGIGPYIVDFYCPNARIVIEIDGESHYTNRVSRKRMLIGISF